MQHHKSQIYQRKNRKGEKGVWYYRKRIPADVLGIWKVNGRSIKEYNASLGTTDKREAERRAVKEHSKFLNILEIKRQESRVVLSESQERIQTHYKYEDKLRRLGAHPEQAPPVNAPPEVIQQYQEAVDQVKYGVHMAGTDGTQEWSVGLVELQQEVGIDQSFDTDGNEIYTPNERYHEIAKDIEFLNGKRGNDYAFSPDVPNLSDALEVYITEVVDAKLNSSDKDRRDKQLRARRVAGALALQLGSGDSQDGFNRPLDTIMNKDAKLFTDTLRIRDDGQGTKSWTSVKREITLIKAIWNNAYKHYNETWPESRKRDNPFKAVKLPNLVEKHDTEVTNGNVQDKTRRPFTPTELEVFLRDYLPRMGEELQLITLICEHTGCRIGDATGLLLGDCRLKTDDTRPIPSLKIHSNHIRQVTKGGIEREIPLFGSVYERLCNFTHGRKGPEQPLFPTYGKSSGAGNASAAINKHIHDLRGADVRLTFHSFRHTVQSKAMAATNMQNKFPAYIGGWNNGDAKGLQAEYQTGGIPIGVLYDALKTIHDVKKWARAVNDPHQDEWM
ncbi:site-specific integrase [Planktomarina temperata]|nr:site-specific integrase [Planktomarina temperata]